MEPMGGKDLCLVAQEQKVEKFTRDMVPRNNRMSGHHFEINQLECWQLPCNS